MRWLGLVVLIACTPPLPAAPSSKVGSIDAWVVAAAGPVANAEVRVVALAPARCACKPKGDDDQTFDNSVPECACPEALAAYRQRLAACAWPLPPRAVLRSDAHGHVALGSDALGSMLETTTGDGVSWLALPARADRVALELAKPITRRLRVDTRAELRAALLFDDGHCIPFRRDGTNEWATAAPVPQVSDVWPVLVVDAPGFAPFVRSWYESGDEPLDVALHRAQPVTGTCDGNAVALDNPFQHVVVRVDRAKRFSIAGVLDLDSTVTCSHDGDVVDEWTYSPADGLQESGGVYGGIIGGSCHDVDVVDRAGRPIAGAELSFDATPGAQFSMGGTLEYTDKRGRACVEDVDAGGDLTVHPPLDRGGSCAGEATVRVTQHMLAAPIRIVLEVQPLRRATWRGRVLSPEKVPIAGAYVAVRDVEPIERSDCSERAEVQVTTGADGTFELPLLPHGTLKLDIQHDWYAEREVEIRVPSGEREIVLDRGVKWTGHVYDPDGKNIDRCDLFLRLPDQRLLTAKCSATGFTFGTLVPGKLKLSVRVEKHALGTFRTLERTIELTSGKQLVQDIHWPAGETIAGRVVDASGAAIAGARLTALPKGVPDRSDRFDADEVMLEADADGRFVFRHLKPGVWTIRGDRRASKQVTLDIKTGTTSAQIVTTR